MAQRFTEQCKTAKQTANNRRRKKKLRLRLTFVFVLLLFLIVSNFVWPEEGGLFAKWSTAVHIGANESHFIERILWQEPNKKM